MLSEAAGRGRPLLSIRYCDVCDGGYYGSNAEPCQPCEGAAAAYVPIALLVVLLAALGAYLYYRRRRRHSPTAEGEAGNKNDEKNGLSADGLKERAAKLSVAVGGERVVAAMYPPLSDEALSLQVEVCVIENTPAPLF